MSTDNENCIPTRSLTLEQAEKLAQDVAAEFGGICTKLKNLKPQIEQIQHAFADHCKGSITIAGCRSFAEFCTKKLHRTKQAVYAMLGEYTPKNNPHVGGGAEIQGARRGTKRGEALAHEDVERMRTACNAAVRCFEAEGKGNKEQAETAKQEFIAISRAESLKSKIFGDQPNCKMILIDLLADMERVGERLPVPLTRKCEAIRKRLGIDESSFGLPIENRDITSLEGQQELAATR